MLRNKLFLFTVSIDRFKISIESESPELHNDLFSFFPRLNAHMAFNVKSKSRAVPKKCLFARKQNQNRVKCCLFVEKKCMMQFVMTAIAQRAIRSIYVEMFFFFFSARI